MRRVVALVLLLVASVLAGDPVLAHDGGVDANGGHGCSSTDASEGRCAPSGSYHCHSPGCLVPSGVTESTDIDGSGGAIQGQVATASPTSAANQTSAPIVATPVPTAAASPRALTNTGTFTDVLGWTGVAVLFFGLALVFIVPARRRARSTRSP